MPKVGDVTMQGRVFFGARFRPRTFILLREISSMKRKVLKAARRVLFLLIVAVMIALVLSGCGFKALFTDFVLINVDHKLLSDTHKNEIVYTYQIDATVTNNSGIDLSDAAVSLRVPDDVLIIQGEETVMQAMPGEENTTYNFSWTITIVPTDEDRNVNYYVEVSSNAISTVFAFESIFVDGKSENDNRLSFSADTWSFRNYDCPKELYLSEEDKNALFFNLAPAEQKRISQRIASGAGGQCYGMAVTAILAKSDRLDLNSMQEGAANLRAVTKTKSAQSTIAYYYLTQFLSPVAEKRSKYKLQDDSVILKDLISLTSTVKQGGTPVLLGFRTSGGGHAVVAYDLQKCNEENQMIVDDKVYDNRVLIYDNNFPDNYVYLYYTADYEWLIAYDTANVNDTTSAETLKRVYQSADKLQFVTNDMEVIDMSNIEQNKKSSFSYIDSRDNEDLEIASGDSVWLINGPTSTDVVGLSADYDIAGSTEFLNISVENKDGEERACTIKSQDSEKALDVSILYNNFFISAFAEGDDVVGFDPAGVAEIQGATSGFELSVTGNPGYAPLSWHTVTVAAEKGDNPKIEIVEDGYVLSCENMSKANIYVEDSATADKVTLRPKTDTLLLTQEGDRLCVKADQDGDGRYETVVATGRETLPGQTMDQAFFLENWGLTIALVAAVWTTVITTVIVLLLRKEKKAGR